MSKKLDKLTVAEAWYQIAREMFKLIQENPGSSMQGINLILDSIDKTFKRLLRRSE